MAHAELKNALLKSYASGLTQVSVGQRQASGMVGRHALQHLRALQQLQLGQALASHPGPHGVVSGHKHGIQRAAAAATGACAAAPAEVGSRVGEVEGSQRDQRAKQVEVACAGEVAGDVCLAGAAGRRLLLLACRCCGRGGRRLRLGVENIAELGQAAPQGGRRRRGRRFLCRRSRGLSNAAAEVGDNAAAAAAAVGCGICGGARCRRRRECLGAGGRRHTGGWRRGRRRG